MVLHSQHLGLADLHSFGIVAKDNKDVTYLSSLALVATTKASQLGIVSSRNVLSQFSGMEVQGPSVCRLAFLPSLLSLAFTEIPCC